ncbi:helix-turn-helix domain-containing protein [Magnetofaba australis]|uniref:Putative transcriptional regulator n=1 Tax=Magnetofaba australis IT-1 TaxID=1434232 RepID=A0A1Y2K696_9PROT|nr:helix-turn-helix domain-containing protein [Magnetofaba australis]OSM04878.1 putative transcriptional regulator [Magnetofaba australis IT-1]
MSLEIKDISQLPEQYANPLRQFAERLREAIGNESVRGFARECGLSEGVLRNYLRGSTYPTLDRLAAIAAAANVDLSWLATGIGDSSPQAVISAPGGGLPDYPEINAVMTFQALAELESYLVENGLELAAEKKADTLRLMLEMNVDRTRGQENKEPNAPALDPAIIKRVLKLVS